MLLTRSAAPRSRAPASPMMLSRRLSMWKCEHWPYSQGFLSGALPPQLQYTHTTTSISISTSTSQPHSSIVSVVLTWSAAPRSRAPAAPILFQPRLPMKTCEHRPRSPRHKSTSIRMSALLQLRQRRVDLQRCAQIPRACSADVVPRKAAHVQA